MDIAHIEWREKDLDTYIAKRHEQRVREEGRDRPEHDSWREDIRRYHERERRERLCERLRFHQAMIRAHTSTTAIMVARHAREPERCELALGLTNGAGHEEAS